MTSPTATAFYDRMREIMDRAVRSQEAEIQAAGDLVATAIRAGGMLHAFGSGHSEALAMELAARAGGLIPSNRIAFRDLVIFGGMPVDTVLDDKIERDPGIARALYELAAPGSGDVVVMASNSGINGTVVELARLVREGGTPLIAITSRAHSGVEESRHPSGSKLLDLADVVLDNGAPHGDALVEVPGGGMVCGVSSITSATLAQLIVGSAVDRLIEWGEEAPVYLSANIARGDEHNNAWEARYAGRLRRSA